MQFYPSVFSPEVSEYMTANGYKLVSDDKDLGVLTFRRGDVGVLFWQDKIERRIISPDKSKVTRMLKSFKGFDGKNIFHLMLILHLIDAVNLKDVKKEVRSMVGEDANCCITELIK
jgi:hypothetical protein